MRKVTATVALLFVTFFSGTPSMSNIEHKNNGINNAIYQDANRFLEKINELDKKIDEKRDIDIIGG